MSFPVFAAVIISRNTFAITTAVATRIESACKAAWVSVAGAGREREIGGVALCNPDQTALRLSSPVTVHL